MSPTQKPISEERINKAVNRRKNRAEEYLNDPQKAQRLLDEAVHKTREREKEKGPAPDFWTHLKAFFRLLRAYIRNDYRDIPWGSIVVVAVAIIYFVSPLDLIPDWIPLSGLVDDAAVLFFVIRQIRRDLDRFLDWELEKASVIAVIDLKAK